MLPCMYWVWDLFSCSGSCGSPYMGVGLLRRAHASGIVPPTTATGGFVSDPLLFQLLPQPPSSAVVDPPPASSEPNLQLPPSTVVDHPPALSAPDLQLPPSTMAAPSQVLSASGPARSSGCVRQPRAVKRASPYARKTHAAKAKVHNGHYSDEEVEILLDIVEAQRPVGRIGWRAAAELFNNECQSRSLDITRSDDSLERKFSDVRHFSAYTIETPLIHPNHSSQPIRSQAVKGRYHQSLSVPKG